MIYLICLFLPFFLSASIIESDSFRACLAYNVPETWVICDIDNTLLESSQQLGSVQWAEDLKKQLHAMGFPAREIAAIQKKVWEEVQKNVQVRLVSEETPRILERLWQEGSFLMALTARSIQEKGVTDLHMQSCHLDFSHKAPKKGSYHYLIRETHVFYDKGILYATASLKKSEALRYFLRGSKRLPKRIIFIDDKMHHIRDIEQMAEEMGIEFIGLRFSGADRRVKAYNPAIARLQWQRLPEIVSDREVETLIGDARQSHMALRKLP